MSNSKKITIVAALLIAVVAIPLFAQLAGLWAGTGEGSCYVPSTGTIPKIIYPWQQWKGTVTSRTFYGEWVDKLGNRGIFRGTFEPVSVPEAAVCKGEWAFGNQIMGKFIMRFDVIKKTCQSEWSGRSSNCKGTMKGSKIK
jgi:hypothetical protein